MKMLKLKAIALITLSFAVMTAIAQSNDTLITFHKFSSSSLSVNNVSNIDSADFIRVVYPQDPATKDYPVKEFYKDGKIKLVGQYSSERFLTSKLGIFNGDCISFYPTGKRRSFTHYEVGRKVGQEYFFYPTGLVNYSIVHDKDFGKSIKYWDFYTPNGNRICENGNGHWITYDENYTPIVEGEIKDGLFDGLWRGKTFEADSIQYTYNYNKGDLVSGNGYKNGKVYPFKNFVEESSIKSNPFGFVDKLRRYFKIPKEINIKKKSLDTAFVSFILEKDGSFSNAEIVGNDEPALKLVLQNALNKCAGEIPKKYYGVPLRSKITISFNDISTTTYSTFTSNYNRDPSINPPAFGEQMIASPATYQKTTTTRKLSLKEEIIGFD